MGVRRLVAFLTAGLAWISQTFLVHRGGESEKMLCSNNFSWIQERPDADRVYADTVCI
jgi:hypothetical protein